MKSDMPRGVYCGAMILSFFFLLAYDGHLGNRRACYGVM